jgi:glycosyltransferase involved in cell wall biosynthesis
LKLIKKGVIRELAVEALKILILTSLYPPLGHSGHDERCREAAGRLSRRGHRLQVITSDHRLPPFGGLDEKGVFRELCRFEDSLKSSVLGRDFVATEAHEMHNAEVFEYRLRRFEPDLVYVWNMDGLSKSLLFRVQRKGIPIVFDLHAEWLAGENFELDPWFRWWFAHSDFRSNFRKKLFSVSSAKRKKLQTLPIAPASELDLSRSYLCSESLRSTLESAGVSGVDSLPVIYPFVNEDSMVPKENYSRKRHFMWAGRVTHSKGPDLAINAVESLRDRGINIKLDVFGMGEQAERKALRMRIVEKGLEDAVQMQGIRPGELREHYQNYDALLFTSRFDDPFPMTVLEAMSSKLPCILADTGGVSEIVTDSVNAILFERDDAPSLAAAIERFLALRDGGETIANRCIQSLRAPNNLDKMLSHIESQL